VPSPNLSSIVHVAGYVTGMVLYAMLFVMTARLGTTSVALVSAPGATRESGRNQLVPYGVALLGLVWNAIALVLYASHDFHLGEPSPWLGAVGFSALGFLPAVVVHSSIPPRDLKRAGRWLVAFAYTLSAVGAAWQFQGAAVGHVPSRPGLLVETVGYAIILLVLVGLAIRDRQGWQRSLFVIALAAFSVSALHLSEPEQFSQSWIVELLGHHSSLPLVLVILYQDYRFAFADLFLRRALSLVALVALAVGLHSFLADSGAVGGGESLEQTIRHITLWVLTALAYPYLRDAIGRFVDRVVLGRQDHAHVRDQITSSLQDAVNTDGLIASATAAVAHALGARRVTAEVDAASERDLVRTSAPLGAAAVARDAISVRIPTEHAPFFVLHISDLAGGRRLLSDDRALLDWLATTLARRIDLIRFSSERYERDLREREILQLATEAEFRALRAQLNPHFLFNALTTVGFLIQTSPDLALQTLYKLTHLLRAVLRRSDGAFVTLAEELELVESYLAIESARFEERLNIVMDIPDALRSVRLPPLLLQPLVENAIKHGIAPLARGGTVTVRAYVDGTVHCGASNRLVLSVHDTGAGLASERAPGDGVGIANIEARLRRYYGDDAEFVLKAPGGDEPAFTQASAGYAGAVAEIRIPMLTPVQLDVRLHAAS
jgi:hypothetical protein